MISENKSEGLPNHVVYFDTETYFDPNKTEQIQDIRLVVGKYQRYLKGKPRDQADWLHTSRLPVFWDWIESKINDNTHLYLFAHNMDFDWAAAKGFEYLSKRGWEIKFFAFDSKVWIIKYHKGKRSITVLDSLQYFDFPIKYLGDYLGLPKKTMPDSSESDKMWYHYCKRDVEILSKIMETLYTFISDHSLGRFAFTSGGQSINAYRHKFMHHPIQVHRFEPVLEIERKAYRGARTEAFWIGDIPASPVYKLDVNSMYPYVMKSYQYPTEYLGMISNPSKRAIKEQIRKGTAILHADIEISEPVIATWTGKLIFPTGSFEAYLTTEEIRWVLAHNTFLYPYELYCYKSDPIFTSFIDYFYPLKVKATKEGDKVLKTNVKLVQNSLYGKFAQRNPKMNVIDELGPDDWYIEYGITSTTHKAVEFVVLGGKVYAQTGYKWAKHSFPAISAEVTANARMYLWDLMRRAGKDHVYYCDTDSIFTDEEGLRRLGNMLDPYKLGYLKIETKAERGTILGAKDYILDGFSRIKGVPRSARKERDGSYSYMTFDKLRTRLRKQKTGIITQREVRKVMQRDYDKGIVTESGRVLPFSLSL